MSKKQDQNEEMGPGGMFVDPDATPENLDAVNLLQEGDDEFAAEVEERAVFTGRQAFKCLGAKNVPAPEGTDKFGQFAFTIRLLDLNTDITVFCSQSPRASFKIEDFVAFAGIKAAGGAIRFKRSDVVGKYGFIELINRPYEGRDRQDFKGRTVSMNPSDLAKYSEVPG